MKDLNPSPYITQLIGICKDAFITEYHPYGTALNLEENLKSLDAKYMSTRHRFSMCMNYVQVLQYIQNSPVGVLLMCDAGSVNQIMRQFLITEDLRLVINDVDRLPVVQPGEGTLCNLFDHHLGGNLKAPEQYWPHMNIKR